MTVPMDVQQSASQLAERLTYPVNGMVAKAILNQLVKRQPNMKHVVDGYCRQQGIDRGQTVRVRPAYLYSTVAAAYSAAGVPPAAIGDLYAQSLGTPDPVLGNLGVEHTNLQQDGRMDADQEFIALAHGFRVLLLNPPSGATADVWANLLAQWQRVAATFVTSAETRQIWGPVGNLLRQTAVHFNGGQGAVAVGPLGGPFVISSVAGLPGHDGHPKLSPPIVLGAGMSFRVQLTMPQAGLATDTDFADAEMSISHMFFGYSRTAIIG